VNELCHLTTRGGATATHIRAHLHHRVIAHPLTVLSTTGANFRANPTRHAMHVRGTHHEISTYLADFSTIEHQYNVIAFGMFTTHLQTVTHGGHTTQVTIRTFLDASLHLGIWIVH
jgi:hypothetical protein